MARTSYYTERVVLLVTPEQRAWIDGEAADRSVSVAEVVRDAIDLARGGAS